ncbi:MAG: SMC-Scp complex subunit ScpB [Betaproteobacteria bacterium]
MSNEQANLNDSPPDIANGSTDPSAAETGDSAGTEMVTALGENGVALPQTIEIGEAKRALEAVLMAASEPMAVNELKRIFEGELSGDTVRNILEELRTEWNDRSVELALVASGYRFRVRPEFQKYLDKLSSEKPPRYSRAVLETLAIIAYRQPVTRGDIEDIRGVQVSPHILKTLQDRGWIDEIGHKEVVGRPALFATTRHFLDDLNLRSLEELPPLHELQATLDMTHAGAALSAGETPSLPGVAQPENSAAPSADINTDDAATTEPALAEETGTPDDAANNAPESAVENPAEGAAENPAGGAAENPAELPPPEAPPTEGSPS